MTNEPDTKQRMKSLKVYVDEHAKALGVSSTEAAILLGVDAVIRIDKRGSALGVVLAMFKAGLAALNGAIQKSPHIE